MPVRLTSTFETSLGQEAANPPVDLSARDPWSVGFCKAECGWPRTPKISRGGYCDRGTEWQKRGSPAPALGQFPASWSPCPWRAGRGSTATAREGPTPLGPCAFSTWPLRTASFVQPGPQVPHPCEKRQKKKTKWKLAPLKVSLNNCKHGLSSMLAIAIDQCSRIIYLIYLMLISLFSFVVFNVSVCVYFITYRLQFVIYM